MTIRLTPTLALSLFALLAAEAQARDKAETPAPVTVGIVAINDFHGALEPPHTSVFASDAAGNVVPVPAGGAAHLASAIDSVRRKYPNHLTVSAGDMIGATQLSSSLFLDEPAIGVMNRIGLDYNAVGNHEFDRGHDELIRKQKGGCVKYTALVPCRIERFAGARFRFLAANSIEPDGKTMFPASAIRSFGKGKQRVKIGIIGLTLKETGDLSSRDGLKGVHFADEADTVNAQVARLKAKGAAAIVLLIHQGGYTKGLPNPSTCPNLTGAIRPILDRLDTRVDVVVSGHTHWSYVCNYGEYNPQKPFLLTSAGVFGQQVTDITLEIDPKARSVIAKRASNLIVQSEGYPTRNGRIEEQPGWTRFSPRADIAAYVETYVAASRAQIQRPAGRLGGEVKRPGGDSSWDGGSLGNLIADAQLAATRGAGAQIAFMNPFGIRAPHMISPASDASVTFGQLYAVQPFNNGLVTQSMSGAELKAVIEEGLDDSQPKQLLNPSQGFSYAYDLSRPAGSRVVEMILDGKPIDPSETYRITVNSFLASGGDSFSGFSRQRYAAIAPINDLEAMEAWLNSQPVLPAPIEARTRNAHAALPAGS